MEKQAIRDQIQPLLNSENILDSKHEANELFKAFYSLINEEKRKRKELEESTPIDQDLPPLDADNEILNQEIEKLISEYKQSYAEIKLAIEKIEKENLELKKQILVDFEALINQEENISKLFNEIKEIRDRWKSVGNIPRKNFEEIQTRYSRLSELFSYNINIYKELQEHDLKKNYSLKNQIIHKLKALNAEIKIKVLEKEVRTLQDEWEDIGPTFKDHWEKLKEDYWAEVRGIYSRIKAFYEDQKEQQANNLKAKMELIERVKELTSNLPSTLPELDKITNDLLAIQEEWKTIGHVPKSENEKIWKEFRSLYDDFFSHKKSLLGEQKEIFAKKADQKKTLIEKAKAVLENPDWKKGSQDIIFLQNSWKKIGHAGKYNEQKLWKEFRQICDDFFTKKEEHFAALDKDNEVNLIAKLELIEKIKKHELDKNTSAALTELKQFAVAFAEIGNVPFKEKDNIYKAYKEVLDKHYNSLKLEESEKSKIEFELKLEGILQAPQPEKILRTEIDKIRKKINDVTKEVANYENNLGFFSNIKGKNPMLEGVLKNIEKGKKEIDQLKKQLKAYSSVEL